MTSHDPRWPSEATRLLISARDELVALSEPCDHSVGICWCSTRRLIDAIEEEILFSYDYKLRPGVCTTCGAETPGIEYSLCENHEWALRLLRASGQWTINKEHHRAINLDGWITTIQLLAKHYGRPPMLSELANYKGLGLSSVHSRIKVAYGDYTLTHSQVMIRVYRLAGFTYRPFGKWR